MRIVIQRNCIYLVIFLNQTCHQDVIESNQTSPKLKSHSNPIPILCTFSMPPVNYASPMLPLPPPSLLLCPSAVSLSTLISSSL